MTGQNDAGNGDRILACAIAQNLEGYGQLIDEMQAVFGNSWGGLDVSDALPVLGSHHAEQMQHVVLAIGAADEAMLPTIMEVISSAKSRGLAVTLVTQDLSAAGLHSLLRSGADEFVPYPLPAGALANALKIQAAPAPVAPAIPVPTPAPAPAPAAVTPEPAPIPAAPAPAQPVAEQPAPAATDEAGLSFVPPSPAPAAPEPAPVLETPAPVAPPAMEPAPAAPAPEPSDAVIEQEAVGFAEKLRAATLGPAPEEVQPMPAPAPEPAVVAEPTPPAPQEPAPQPAPVAVAPQPAAPAEPQPAVPQPAPAPDAVAQPHLQAVPTTAAPAAAVAPVPVAAGQVPMVHSSQTRRGIIFPIYGLAGGVGTSTFATNLAWELQSVIEKDNRRVCILDFDFLFGSVSTYLDVPRSDAALELLTNAQAADGQSFESTMRMHANKLAVFPTPLDSVPLDIVGGEEIGAVLDIAAELYDYVIVDLPNALTSWSETVLDRARLYFALGELEMRSAQNALRFLRVLKADDLPYEKVQFIINRAPKRTDLNGRSRVKRMSDSLNVEFRWLLPDGGRHVLASCDQGTPLATANARNPLRKEIRKIAENLVALSEEDADVKASA